jgi:poly(A) polymerase
MARASGVVNDIMQGQKPWKALFERHSFFTRDYRYYLRVIAASKTSEEQLSW